MFGFSLASGSAGKLRGRREPPQTIATMRALKVIEVQIAIERASDDTFFISIESWDPRFDPSATATLLKSLGARSVELLES